MWSLWVVFKSWFLDLRISETIQENVTLRTRQCSFDESKQYLFIYLFGILKFIKAATQINCMVPFKIATCTFSPFLQEPSSKLLYKNHMTQGQVVQFIPWINFTSCKWNRLLATFLVTVTLFHFFFHFFSSCLKCSQLLNWFFTHFLCELSLMCTLPIICDFRGYPYPVFLVQV